MDSFKRTLRRLSRLIWLFVIAAVVLIYADVSDAKGGGGHGGGHGGGGRSSHSSSHASSRSSSHDRQSYCLCLCYRKVAVVKEGVSSYCSS